MDIQKLEREKPKLSKMPRVIYRSDGEFVKILKSDRKVAKKLKIKLGRKRIVTVEKYATFLNKVSKKRK